MLGRISVSLVRFHFVIFRYICLNSYTSRHIFSVVKRTFAIRFATCQWEPSTPTDTSIPLAHRLVLHALEAGECLSAFKDYMSRFKAFQSSKTASKRLKQVFSGLFGGLFCIIKCFSACSMISFLQISRS